MTKILVIEDEAFVRGNIIMLLELENYEVRGAENGLIGVQLAEEQPPDLIICDIMMPQLDGYGVLNSLRNNPSTATVPFIFLTAKTAKEDLRQGMELGASDYLEKPFSREELLKAIQTQIKKQVVIEQQSEQKLKALRNSISLSLPHELKTPLIGIKGFSEILKDSAEDLSPEEVRDMASDIYTSAERLEDLIQNFLLYANLELIAATPEKLMALRQDVTISAKTIILQAINQKVKRFPRESDLYLSVQDASVRISETHLKKLIEELIDNAFKYSSPGSPVKVRNVLSNKKFVLKITNEGQGMTAEQIAQIGAYMQFERQVKEQQGSGLGLYIAKRITELYEGQFKIESIPFQQTTVQIELPQ